MERALELEVVDVPALAGEEARVFLAQDALADETAHVADFYQRTRGGGGVPCPSCHEITGLRSTPIFSISASITSPGLRYSEAASGENPATPDTVPVDTTSPAEYPSAE